MKVNWADPYKKDECVKGKGRRHLVCLERRKMEMGRKTKVGEGENKEDLYTRTGAILTVTAFYTWNGVMPVAEGLLTHTMILEALPNRHLRESPSNCDPSDFRSPSSTCYADRPYLTWWEVNWEIVVEFKFNT